MARFLFVLALMLLPVTGTAQEGSVQSVISQQFEAFKQDDFETAFTFASPAIKRIFQTPERFGQMVRKSYPMVWRPAEVEFLDQSVEGGRVYQQVLIRDGAGQFHALEYEVIPSDDGWQINGVRFLPNAPPTA